MLTIEHGTSENTRASKPDLQENWQIAKKRTAALVIDGAITSGIVSIPILFNLGTLPEFSVSVGFMQRLYHAVAKDHVVLFSIALLCTPVPIIYLRLCFRVFMNSQTPGEMLMGLVTDFIRKNSSVWMNEILYGLAQYWYVLYSCVMGTIAYAAVMMVFWGTVGFFVYPFFAKFSVTLLYLFWAMFILQPLLLCHYSRTKGTTSIYTDRLLNLEVAAASRGREL